MKSDANCIFCRIARGELDVPFVYEDEMVVAFDDASPQAPVHTLVIPRDHHINLSDGVDEKLMSALFCAVPRVARIKGVGDSGYRVVVNNGHDANQTVMHLHVHIIGGRAMTHGMAGF